jgi:regulator of replication initiation timing
MKTIIDLAKYVAALKRVSAQLDTLRLKVIALLHDNESLKRENAILRELLNDKM